MPIKTDEPAWAHPKFESFNSKVESFAGKWSSQIEQTPEEMAKAGFFYSGPADCCTCASCGLTITELHPKENPIQTHNTWVTFLNYKCVHLKENYEKLMREYVKKSGKKSKKTIKTKPVKASVLF